MTFSLVDFDSPDYTSDNITLTLVSAVDEGDERLLLNETGTDVLAGVPTSQEFTVRYLVSGGSSFTEYQQVRPLCSKIPYMVHEPPI